MIDLIQLVSMQQLPKDMELTFDDEDNNTSQDSIAFMTIMAHLLMNETSAVGEMSNKNVEPMLEPDNQLKLDANDAKPIVSLEQLEQPDDSTENDEEIDFSSENNAQLAWFYAESFEPPKVNIDELKNKNNESTTVKLPQPIMPSVGDAKLTTVTTFIENDEQTIKNTFISASDEEGQLTPEISELEQFEMGNSKKTETVSVKIVADKGSNNSINLNVPSVQPVELSTLQFSSTTSKQSSEIEPLEARLLLPVAEKSSDENEAYVNVSTTPPNQITPLNQSSHSVSVAAPKTIYLAHNLSNPEWGNQFNQQIMWLGQQKIKTAIIKLNPQELGPLEVNIKMVKDIASINITTHTVQVRDLIEHAIPRLRDMMSEQGVNLTQVNIESNNSQRQSQRNSDSLPGKHDITEEQAIITPLISKNDKGIIDYFA